MQNGINAGNDVMPADWGTWVEGTYTRTQSIYIYIYTHTHTHTHVQNGINAGNDVMPAGWGTWVEGTKGEDKLAAAGVKVDSWPIDMIKGFPLPAVGFLVLFLAYICVHTYELRWTAGRLI